MKNSAYTKFRYKLFAFRFASDFMPIYALYGLLFVHGGGLSIEEISYLFIMWIVASLGSEIPTGIIADHISRRTALMWSELFKAICFATWMFFDQFWGYALGFALWGISWALQSGALQAYVFEESRAFGKKHEFTKLYTRMSSFSLAGMFFSYIIAAALVERGFDIVLLISIVFSLCALGIASILPKDSSVSKEQSLTSYTNTLLTALREVLRKDLLKFAAISLALIAAYKGVLEEFVPLYYNARGVEVSAVPLVLAAGFLVSIALSWNAHLLKKWGSIVTVALALLAAVALFVSSLLSPLVAIGGLFVFMRLMRLAELLLEENYQHLIEARDSRATLTSVPSFVGYFIAISLTYIYGEVSDQWGDARSMQVLSLLLIVIVVLGLLRRKYLQKDK